MCRKWNWLGPQMETVQHHYQQVLVMVDFSKSQRQGTTKTHMEENTGERDRKVEDDLDKDGVSHSTHYRSYRRRFLQVI